MDGAASRASSARLAWVAQRDARKIEHEAAPARPRGRLVAHRQLAAGRALGDALGSGAVNLHLHALQSPGMCEAIAPISFDDVGMPYDETLGRSLQHGVDGACGRGLIRNLLSGVGRYAHPLVEAGNARGTTQGPVVLGVSSKDNVCAQQGLRWLMVEHRLVPKRHAPKWQGLKLGNLLAELGVVDC